MNEVMLRYHKGTFHPFSEEDAQLCMEYYSGQPIKAKMSTVRKPRSYEQLKAYWACCRTVASNTSNTDFNTAKKVDLQLRVKLGWVEDTIIIKDKVQFIPKSISYKVMKHLEACRYFERAFEQMAGFLSVTVEELLRNADA